MGQTSISVLNKVGYSMYWNSMWDNKIVYNRFLKEDFYLNDFFNLLFFDNMSYNIYNLNYIKNKYKNNYKFFQNVDKKFFKKYINNVSKMDCYTSKIWILKYQKWMIIYYFIFFTKSSKVSINSVFNFDYEYKHSSLSLFKYFFKFNNNFKFSYKLYNSSIKKVIF